MSSRPPPPHRPPCRSMRVLSRSRRTTWSGSRRWPRRRPGWSGSPSDGPGPRTRPRSVPGVLRRLLAPRPDRRHPRRAGADRPRRPEPPRPAWRPDVGNAERSGREIDRKGPHRGRRPPRDDEGAAGPAISPVLSPRRPPPAFSAAEPNCPSPPFSPLIPYSNPPEMDPDAGQHGARRPRPNEAISSGGLWLGHSGRFECGPGWNTAGTAGPTF